MNKTKVIINQDKCKLSGQCVKVCPQQAISIKDGKASIDYDKCDSDGICISVCPEGAITTVESNEQGG